MTQTDYEQKRAECWHEYFSADKRFTTAYEHEISKDAFYSAFDRAYALGKEKETITQEEVEKAAEEYVLTRQQARHDAKKEEDATILDFDKTIKAWDAYDMEQAFESGANFALGKKEKDAEDTVIQGWVARDKSGDLYLYRTKPSRNVATDRWSGESAEIDLYNNLLFPDLTWSDNPQEIEIIIKRKKK